MSKDLRKEMRKLRLVEPRVDLWEEVLARRASKRTGNYSSGSRVPALIVGITLLTVLAGSLALLAMRMGGRQAVESSGGRIAFIRLSPTLINGPHGSHQVRVSVTSDLPAGTVIAYVYEETGAHGYRLASPLRDGQTGAYVTAACGPAFETRPSGFKLVAFAAPTVNEALLPALASKKLVPAQVNLPEGLPFVQPPSVLKQLGSRFQRLSGAQVIDILGMHVVLVSANYHWPSVSCADRSK